MIVPALVRCLLFACLSLPLAAQQTKASIYSPSEQLRNYAMSVCLANAFPNTAAGKDASAAASAYIENGSGPIDSYGQIAHLAQQFLARPYQGQANVSFQTMKCLDFYHSPELGQLIQKFNRAPHKQPRSKRQTSIENGR